MLEFLQTGKMLYVLATVCAMGILSKMVTSSLYKRLIKETNNMALTKNKNLKNLKQKTENLFLVTRGIRNSTAYIEKQIYGFSFLKMPLDNWDNLSVQAMILCFLAGGASSFGAYWYRVDSYYIVLYAAVGVLSGLFLVFVDSGANISGKRQQLSDCLVDYIENSPHFYRPMDHGEYAGREQAGTAVSIARPRFGDRRAKQLRTAEETAASQSDAGLFSRESEEQAKESDTNSHGAQKKGSGRLSLISKKKESRADKQSHFNPLDQTEELSYEKSAPHVVGELHQNKTARPSDRSNKNDMARRGEELRRADEFHDAASRDGEAVHSKEAAGRDDQVDEDELARSIEGLRLSLEQAAVSKDARSREAGQPVSPKNARAGKEPLGGRKLKPEEIKLLGELLQDYLHS